MTPRPAHGSEQWHAWLQTATTFYYSGGSAGRFTARRETKQRGGDYWIAYRRADGKLRKVYLGKPEALTADRLAEAARRLVTPNSGGG
jgi:LuxR family maltose regulon positive regulatory protein